MAFSLITGSIKRKLLLAVTIILVAGTAAVVWVSTSLQVRDARMFMLKSSSDMASAIGADFRQQMQQTLDLSRGWIVQNLKSTWLPGQDVSSLVDGAGLQALLDKSGSSIIVGIQVFDAHSKQIAASAMNSALKGMTSFGPGLVKADGLVSGSIEYRSVEVGGVTYHQLVAQLLSDEERKSKGLAPYLVVYLKPEELKAIFRGDGVAQAMLFDSQGSILFKSDTAALETYSSAKRVPDGLLKAAKTSPLTNGQIALRTTNQKIFIGSFSKTGAGGLHVAVLVDEDRIFETPRKVALRSIYLGIAILSLALVFAIFFSDSIARPIRALADAAEQIRLGDFSVRAQSNTRDEVHKLTTAFNHMAEGLAEREKLKSVFGKFHSKAVVEKLMGEDKIRLGGERLLVTVFFSDIRSFTSSSEKMSPEAVVEMLNEYMTEMVAVIEKYDGVVDKYVGDAIMAVWGMPTPDPRADAEKSVKACLEMREKLKDLNLKRAARKQDPIKIGMGLNSGEVIAGNIGSQSRMEYTVIGDTVNTASRMESLTKEFKTDFLINESTVALLPKGMFELGAPMEASAKGKAEKIQVYGCTGYAQVTTLKAA